MPYRLISARVSGECGQFLIDLAAQMMRLPASGTFKDLGGGIIQTGQDPPTRGQQLQVDPVRALSDLGLLRIHGTQYSLTVEGMRAAAALMPSWPQDAETSNTTPSKGFDELS